VYNGVCADKCVVIAEAHQQQQQQLIMQQQQQQHMYASSTQYYDPAGHHTQVVAASESYHVSVPIALINLTKHTAQVANGGSGVDMQSAMYDQYGYPAQHKPPPHQPTMGECVSSPSITRTCSDSYHM
jgi:hypothetical protein